MRLSTDALTIVQLYAYGLQSVKIKACEQTPLQVQLSAKHRSPSQRSRRAAGRWPEDEDEDEDAHAVRTEVAAW